MKVSQGALNGRVLFLWILSSIPYIFVIAWFPLVKAKSKVYLVQVFEKVHDSS